MIIEENARRNVNSPLISLASETKGTKHSKYIIHVNVPPGRWKFLMIRVVLVLNGGGGDIKEPP